MADSRDKESRKYHQLVVEDVPQVVSNGFWCFWHKTSVQPVFSRLVSGAVPSALRIYITVFRFYMMNFWMRHIYDPLCSAYIQCPTWYCWVMKTLCHESCENLIYVMAQISIFLWLDSPVFEGYDITLSGIIENGKSNTGIDRHCYLHSDKANQTWYCPILTSDWS